MHLHYGDRPMTIIFRRALVASVTATALSLTAAGTMHAQQYSAANAPRWRAWLGCWAAAVDTSRLLSPGSRVVCVAPTDDANIVDVSAFSDGQVLSRDRIDASGRPHVVDVNNCTGTESAQWSDDQRRVFLRSSVVCDGIPRQMTAVLAINQVGDWLDVRSTTAGRETNVRVARYRDVGIPDGVPSDISRPLIDHRMSTLSARIATGARVGTAAIVEAAHMLDAATLEAFTRESGQRFATDARTLTELADAGVPARVTDAMIEVSNRTVFSGDRGDEGYRRLPRSCGIYGCYGSSATDGWDQGTGQRIYVTVYPAYDPWGFGYWPFGRYYARGLLGYAPYGYAPYGLAPYGYGGGGYGFGDNYRGRSVTGYYRPPVIVLHANQGGTESRGRSERGRGYTTGERAVPRPPDTRADPPPTGRTATPRPGSPPPAQEQAPSKANERSGGNENRASNTERTARPRP